VADNQIKQIQDNPRMPEAAKAAAIQQIQSHQAAGAIMRDAYAKSAAAHK